MSSDDVLIATIDDLMETFRSALLALLPLADKAKLAWTDADSHPDWERLARCAFDAFVRGPIGTDRSRGRFDASLAPYDIDSVGYGESSWVGVGDSGSPSQALIRLVSVVRPFDSVQVVDVDLDRGLAGARQIVPWDRARFVLVRRSKTGRLHYVETVVAEE